MQWGDGRWGGNTRGSSACETFKKLRRSLEHLRDPVITMQVALSAFHDLVFTTYHPAKKEVGWSAIGLPSLPSPGDRLSFSPLSFTQHCAFCLFTASIQGPLTADVAGGEPLSKTPQRPLIVRVTLISKNSRLKSEPKHFSTSLADDPNFSVYTHCANAPRIHALALVKSEIIFWSR